MKVLIGVDPHKGSHTAVAIGHDEVPLGQLRVRATRMQCEQLLEWAEVFPERRWAIESAGGLGYLLAQQLIAAGEQVVDVPPTLSARVRLLGSGKSQKNDPNDALSTAVAALRHRRLHAVVADDQAVILRMLADRHHDLTQDAHPGRLPPPCAARKPCPRRDFRSVAGVQRGRDAGLGAPDGRCRGRA